MKEKIFKILVSNGLYAIGIIRASTATIECVFAVQRLLM